MADFIIPENPTFSAILKQIEVTDPVHADILNALIGRLLVNDVYLENLADALDAAIGAKAAQAELDTHTGNAAVHVTGADKSKWDTAGTKADTALQSIQVGGVAQAKTDGMVNLPAYPSSVAGNAGTATKLQTPRSISITGGASGTGSGFDGSSNFTIPVTALDMSKASTGTLPLAHGGTGAADAAEARTNLGITPANIGAVDSSGTITAGQVATFADTAGNIKSSGFTLAASVPEGAKFTDTVYTHPVTSGNKHIPAGGAEGQVLGWDSDSAAKWVAQSRSTVLSGTLTADGWTGTEVPYKQTLAIAEVTADNIVELVTPADVTQEQIMAFQEAQILNGTQAVGRMTLNCWGIVPRINLPVTIIVRGDI